jgi:hypothetical protein
MMTRLRAARTTTTLAETEAPAAPDDQRRRSVTVVLLLVPIFVEPYCLVDPPHSSIAGRKRLERERQNPDPSHFISEFLDAGRVDVLLPRVQIVNAPVSMPGAGRLRAPRFDLIMASASMRTQVRPGPSHRGGLSRSSRPGSVDTMHNPRAAGERSVHALVLFHEAFVLAALKPEKSP